MTEKEKEREELLKRLLKNILEERLSRLEKRNIQQTNDIKFEKDVYRKQELLVDKLCSIKIESKKQENKINKERGKRIRDRGRDVTPNNLRAFHKRNNSIKKPERKIRNMTTDIKTRKRGPEKKENTKAEIRGTKKIVKNNNNISSYIMGTNSNGNKNRRNRYENNNNNERTKLSKKAKTPDIRKINKPNERKTKKVNNDIESNLKLIDSKIEEKKEHVPIEEKKENVPIEEKKENVPIEEKKENVPIEDKKEHVPIEEKKEEKKEEIKIEKKPEKEPFNSDNLIQENINTIIKITMSKVNFNYNETNYFVQCNSEDKMKDIISKFLGKINKDRKNLGFLYNGQIINEALSFNQCANRLDRSRNYMSVLVIQGQDSNDSINLKKSNYIICPDCNENALLSIKDFNLSIEGCNSGHKTKNLELKELEKTQMIDQSQIFCDICHISKSNVDENKFFFCIKCKQKLCPGCKDIHNEQHKDYIKEYDDSQFYCQIHCIGYTFYCLDCKKDLCELCRQEHDNHNIITYDSITPDINIRGNELRDTKDKIYHLKTKVNGMIYQLNNLNKNLDTYFDIYDNIVTNTDIKKRNFCLLKTVNNIKKYNSNFIGNITEIIKDDNMKSQFTDIISLQSKIDFNRFTKKNQPREIRIDEEEKNTNNNSENDNNIRSISDKYENFNINKMKELQSFKVQYRIFHLLVLNDGRILTIQLFESDETEEYESYSYKLCVYSVKNGFVCDINMDFYHVIEIYKMDDGNIILAKHKSKEEYIKIIKVNKNYIEEIFNLEKTSREILKLSEDKFLINVVLSKEQYWDDTIVSLGPDNRHFKFTCEQELYTYNNNKLIPYKNIEKLNKDENINNALQIDENEYIFYGKNEDFKFLLFYDIEKALTIKKLKVSDTDKHDFDMLLINRDKLIVRGDESIVLIDTKNREIIEEYKMNLFINHMIFLNEKVFLDKNEWFSLSQYEFENLKTLKLKERIEFNVDLMLKYPGNKIIICCDKKIAIYG